MFLVIQNRTIPQFGHIFHIKLVNLKPVLFQSGNNNLNLLNVDRAVNHKIIFFFTFLASFPSSVWQWRITS